jgi:hypothetical protein
MSTKNMVGANANTVTHVYLRSNDHEWIPALQLKSGNGKATVAVPKFNNERDMLNCAKASKYFKYNDNQVVNLNDYANGVLPMANVDASGNPDEYKDMVNLPFMHEVWSWSPLIQDSHSHQSSFIFHPSSVGGYSVQPQGPTLARTSLHTHRGRFDCRQSVQMVRWVVFGTEATLLFQPTGVGAHVDR